MNFNIYNNMLHLYEYKKPDVDPFEEEDWEEYDNIQTVETDKLKRIRSIQGKVFIYANELYKVVGGSKKERIKNRLLHKNKATKVIDIKEIYIVTQEMKKKGEVYVVDPHTFDIIYYNNYRKGRKLYLGLRKYFKDDALKDDNNINESKVNDPDPFSEEDWDEKEGDIQKTVLDYKGEEILMNDAIWCEWSSEYCDAEYAVYSNYVNSYLTPDDLEDFVYIGYINDYIPFDSAVWCDYDEKFCVDEDAVRLSDGEYAKKENVVTDERGNKYHKDWKGY